MRLAPALSTLWQGAAFRRLLVVRLLSQAADGTLLVGMGSYLLFSPQNQPDAWAIAGVLALTLLPFSLLGPFISPFLDRWSRRQVALISDVVRATLALLAGLLIATSNTTGIWEVVLYAALLVALSLNRFMLAGLSAGLQHTVSREQYLTASSVMPVMGPLGVVIGGVIGFSARAGLAGWLGVDGANAVVFFVAAAMFAASVAVCAGFSRDALGPDTGAPLVRAVDVLRGLLQAVRHLGQRPEAAIGLGVMAVTRFLFGMLTVIIIISTRAQYGADVDGALKQIALWGGVTGAGFILASVVTPVLARWCGLGGAVTILLVAGGMSTFVMVAWPHRVVVLLCSFIIGLSVQAAKICVDTLMQAHVDENQKGRAFMIYDMLYNLAFTGSAVAVALAVPTGQPAQPWLVAATGGVYLVVALLFWLAASRPGLDFNRGTGSLTGRPVASDA